MDGSALQLAPSHRRRSIRRQVQLETEVMSSSWDGAVPLLMTNVSLHGLWIESDLALGIGEELSVSFIPPQWPHAIPFHARARVTRVGLLRRRADSGLPGMGVTFLDLRSDQCERLALALRGVPPPLPRRLYTPVRSHGAGSTSLVLADGTCFKLLAEAELLTAGRGPLPQAWRWPCVTSPMSAILRTGRGVRA